MLKFNFHILQESRYELSQNAVNAFVGYTVAESQHEIV